MSEVWILYVMRQNNFVFSPSISGIRHILRLMALQKYDMPGFRCNTLAAWLDETGLAAAEGPCANFGIA